MDGARQTGARQTAGPSTTPPAMNGAYPVRFAAPPTGRAIAFGLFPRTALRLSWAIFLPPLRGCCCVARSFQAVYGTTEVAPFKNINDDRWGGHHSYRDRQEMYLSREVAPAS